MSHRRELVRTCYWEGKIPGKVRSTFQHAHKQLPPAKEDAERTVAGPWRPSIFQESAVWLLPLGPEGLHDRMEDELHCHLQVFAASLFLEEVELLDLELGHEGWDSLPLDCPILSPEPMPFTKGCAEPRVPYPSVLVLFAEFTPWFWASITCRNLIDRILEGTAEGSRLMQQRSGAEPCEKPLGNAFFFSDRTKCRVASADI